MKKWSWKGLNGYLLFPLDFKKFQEVLARLGNRKDLPQILGARSQECSTKTTTNA